MNKLIQRYPGAALLSLFVLVACGESLIELLFQLLGI